MRRGFTLVELMVAMALGVAIILIAFGVFRSVQQANRGMAAERQLNRLLLVGYRAGMAELDHWIAFDNPAHAAGQAQRAAGQPFRALNLPDAAWRWDPSDPRCWDRSGARAFHFAPQNNRGVHEKWPDHSQICGVGHGDGDAALLHQTQEDLFLAGGGGLLVHALPGHIPLGNIRNGSGWSNQAPNTFARNGMYESVVFRYRTDQADGSTGDWNSWNDFQDWTRLWHAGRTGRLVNSGTTKRYVLSARPYWASLLTATNAKYLDTSRFCVRSGSTGLYVLGDKANPETTLDQALVNAGNPGFFAGDSRDLAYRLEVRRELNAGGTDQVVFIHIADNQSGRRLVLPFRAVSTTLRGARMSRGLDQ